MTVRICTSCKKTWFVAEQLPTLRWETCPDCVVSLAAVSQARALEADGYIPEDISLLLESPLSVDSIAKVRIYLRSLSEKERRVVATSNKFADWAVRFGSLEEDEYQTLLAQAKEIADASGQSNAGKGKAEHV